MQCLRVFGQDNWQQSRVSHLIIPMYEVRGQTRDAEDPREVDEPRGGRPNVPVIAAAKREESRPPPSRRAEPVLLASHGRRTCWKSGIEAIHQMHLVSSLGPGSCVWWSGGYPAQGGEPIMGRHPAVPRETVASGAVRLHEENAISASGPSAWGTLPHGTGSDDPARRTGGCRSTADNRRPTPLRGRPEEGEAQPQRWDVEVL